MHTQQWRMDSEIGSIYLLASDSGLAGIYWEKQSVPLVKNLKTLNNGVSKFFIETAQQINEYLSGRRKQFDIPLDITGTLFQRQVWNELAKIPYGSTCSYKDIAKKINNSKAVRAVGSANSKNPLSIIVPCHRVIAADGGLGGYAGGLEIKEKLLKLESSFCVH